MTQRTSSLSASIHDLQLSLEAETRPPARIPALPTFGERIKSRVKLSFLTYLQLGETGTDSEMRRATVEPVV